MIRRDHGDAWLLIRQPEHARLSGDLCEAWALEPEPTPVSVVKACAHHDDGWLAWERRPKVCSATGRPLSFPETELADDLVIWREGPALVGAQDPYAGLLVSGHGSALMQSKLLRESTEQAKRERMQAYLLEQEAFRDELARTAGLAEALCAPTYHGHLTLLQLVDYISLVACCRPIRAEETLRVGEGPHQRSMTLRARSPAKIEAQGGVTQTIDLDPWPFVEDRLAFAAEGIIAEQKRWSEAALADHVANAPTTRLELVCARASAS